MHCLDDDGTSPPAHRVSDDPGLDCGAELPGKPLGHAVVAVNEPTGAFVFRTPRRATAGECAFTDQRRIGSVESGDVLARECPGAGDESRWTLVQGILAPIQFLVFLVSVTLVLHTLVTGDGAAIAAVAGPLPPGIYDYTFNADGVTMTDPNSENVFGNRKGSRGFVEVA